MTRSEQMLCAQGEEMAAMRSGIPGMDGDWAGARRLRGAERSLGARNGAEPATK
jgi:hypothetical protein